MSVKDHIDQDVTIGDFVVSYNNVYEVLGVGAPGNRGTGYVRMLLVKPSKTTRPVSKHSTEIVKVDREAVLSWVQGG